MIRALISLSLLASNALACDGAGTRLSSDTPEAPITFIAIDEIPLSHPFSLQVTLCDPAHSNGPATLQIDARMPAHQHGMNYTPDVTDRGNGVYDITGMLFHMPGLWEIQVTLETDTGTYPYTHAVTLK